VCAVKLQVIFGMRGNPQSRVLVVGGNSFPDCMEWHVMEALGVLGCDAELFDVRTLVTGWTLGNMVAHKIAYSVLREPELLRERALLRASAEFAPDLVLVLAGKSLAVRTIEKLRGVTRAPIVCWFQDALIAMGRQHILGAGYDAVFLKDRYLHDLYSRMLSFTKFYYLPEACNPRIHRRSAELTEDEWRRYSCDVMVAGTIYYYRQEILRRLDEYDLKLWGGVIGFEWMVRKLKNPLMRHVVWADEKAKAVKASRLVLNTLHYAEINGLNCRAFEMAGCGGCQLISTKPVLSEHFDLGTEIVSFDSADDLVEKVRHYLSHPEAALEIGRLASVRAHRDHTYEKRLNEIFTIVLGSTNEDHASP
jgi:spore maturation protein CgeB